MEYKKELMPTIIECNNCYYRTIKWIREDIGRCRKCQGELEVISRGVRL